MTLPAHGSVFVLVVRFCSAPPVQCFAALDTVRWEDMDKGNVPLEKLALQYEAFNRTESKTEKTVS